MKAYLDSLQQVVAAMQANPQFDTEFAKVKAIFAEALPLRKKILIAGNGGSAGEAQHFAATFTSHFKKERKAYPAIALTTDSSALTAIGNDYGLDQIFSRQIEALGEAGDIFIAMSTSGNSKNILVAIAIAKSIGMKTVALSGKDGGAMKGMCDAEFIIPSTSGALIQELHLVILHAFAEASEAYTS